MRSWPPGRSMLEAEVLIRCRKKQRREGEMRESAWVPKSYNPNRMFCLWCCSTHIHTHRHKSSLEHKHFALVTTKNHVKTTHRMHYNMVNDNRRQKIHTGKHNMLDVGLGFGRCIARTHTHTNHVCCRFEKLVRCRSLNALQSGNCACIWIILACSVLTSFDCTVFKGKIKP